VTINEQAMEWFRARIFGKEMPLSKNDVPIAMSTAMQIAVPKEMTTPAELQKWYSRIVFHG